MGFLIFFGLGHVNRVASRLCMCFVRLRWGRFPRLRQGKAYTAVASAWLKSNPELMLLFPSQNRTQTFGQMA
ncbi:hypothetical protein F4774DRAFT_367413 [Daldinia eschscholtzii]|nr:hypothetical protein F4774DRAFT_367413 [Daldinia eschscholtzii]